MNHRTSNDTGLFGFCLLVLGIVLIWAWLVSPTGPAPTTSSATGGAPALRCQEDEVHITSRANGCVTIDDLPFGNVRSAAESITTKCKPGTGWVDPTPHSTEVVAWCTTYQR
jgi:hypothetical protein